MWSTSLARWPLRISQLFRAYKRPPMWSWSASFKLRDVHQFEKRVSDGEDLYAPASVIFAGALARTDRARDVLVQGPVGSKFGQLKGGGKSPHRNV